MNTLTMALTPCTVAVPMVTASHWAFWTLAPIMVLAALGMVVARKPVHSALFLAVIMISLAVQYASMQAPFLFVVQIIVYTGAILMLFLFVVMLVGVDTSESLADTLRSHRVASTIAAIGIGAMLVRAWHRCRWRRWSTPRGGNAGCRPTIPRCRRRRASRRRGTA